ncbi:MAG: hypothetical protein ACI90C_000879 [Rhodoferax sp.]|jgi:hypothetical protein
MQYTLTLTTRMLTLAGICLLTLFVLLFLLGVEIGKKWAVPEVEAAIAARANVPTTNSIGSETEVKSAIKLNTINAK